MILSWRMHRRGASTRWIGRPSRATGSPTAKEPREEGTTLRRKAEDTTTEAMRLHPDLAELRAKYEAAAETPVAGVVAGLTFLVGLYLAISPVGSRVQRVHDADRQRPDRRHRPGSARPRVRTRPFPDSRHHLGRATARRVDDHRPVDCQRRRGHHGDYLQQRGRLAWSPCCSVWARLSRRNEADPLSPSRSLRGPASSSGPQDRLPPALASDSDNCPPSASSPQLGRKTAALIKKVN